jgi:hypothetical protein
VNVELLIVLVFIVSLNLITTGAVAATPVAPSSGCRIVTVGGVVSPPGTVVNVELKGVRPLFARSFAPDVTLTV